MPDAPPIVGDWIAFDLRRARKPTCYSSARTASRGRRGHSWTSSGRLLLSFDWFLFRAHLDRRAGRSAMWMQWSPTPAGFFIARSCSGRSRRTGPGPCALGDLQVGDL